MAGSPHSVLSSLVLCNRPCVSTLLSRTSTPNTLGFMGLGYFCMAALVTVSHGWLLKTMLTSGTATSKQPFQKGLQRDISHVCQLCSVTALIVFRFRFLSPTIRQNAWLWYGTECWKSSNWCHMISFIFTAKVDKHGTLPEREQITWTNILKLD